MIKTFVKRGPSASHPPPPPFFQDNIEYLWFSLCERSLQACIFYGQYPTMKDIFLLGNIFSVCFKGLSTTSQFVTEPTSLFLKTSTKNVLPYMFLWYSCQGHALSFLSKKSDFASPLHKQTSGGSLLTVEI